MKLQQMMNGWWTVCSLITLCFLGGCVAPDGTVFRLQQAPDGTIAGWQVDAPTATTAAGANDSDASAASTTTYPDRPILYLDAWVADENVPVNAVDSEGGKTTVVGEGQIPVMLGWSPQGERLAYFAVDDETGALYLEVTTPGTKGERLLDFAPDEIISYWGMAPFWVPAAWSPDGSQIALARGISIQDEPDSRIALVNVADGAVAGEFPLPKESVIPYVIAWSPDGEKLLVVGEHVAILDLDSGRWAQIRDEPNFMEWLPGSDGVLYVNYADESDTGASDNEQAAGLWLEIFGEEPQLLLSSDQLLANGLNVNERIDLALSPTGRYLTLLNSGAWDDEGTTLALFELAALQSAANGAVDTPQPLAHWQLPDAITPVEWSPDEGSLAFLQASDAGITLERLPITESAAQRVTEIATGDPAQVRGIFVNLVNMPFRLLSWMP